MNKKIHIAGALLSEVCISYSSIILKETSIPPTTAGVYRILLSIPIFLVMAYPSIFSGKVKVKDAFMMIVAGVMFGIDILFFNLSVHETSIAHVSLIASLVCFVLVPISYFLYKEKITANFFLGYVVTISGLVMLLNSEEDDNVATLYGDTLAFISMIGYALFLAIMYKLRRVHDTPISMFYSGVGSLLLMIPSAVVIDGGFRVVNEGKELEDMLLLSLFGQLLGQGLLGYVVGKLSSQVVSSILLLVPVISTGMAFVILGEKIGVSEAIGIAIILGGVYIASKK